MIAIGLLFRPYTVVLWQCLLVAEIHDRMPAILAPDDYTRWLSDEPDPHDQVGRLLAQSVTAAEGRVHAEARQAPEK